MCLNQYKDMVHVLQAVQANSSLHPALASANFSRVGIFGHSMGAINTASAIKDYTSLSNVGTLGAAVYLHAGSSDPLLNKQIKIPILTTTGTADADVSPASTKRSWEEQSNAHPRVFANLKGAVHNESAVHGRLNPFIAAFFSCHVAQLSGQCDRVYGNGSADLCQAHPMQDCEVVQ